MQIFIYFEDNVNHLNILFLPILFEADSLELNLKFKNCIENSFISFLLIFKMYIRFKCLNKFVGNINIILTDPKSYIHKYMISNILKIFEIYFLLKVENIGNLSFILYNNINIS